MADLRARFPFAVNPTMMPSGVEHTIMKTSSALIGR